VSYRGRFAPSPTGELHFGSLITALGSFLDARNRDGVWLVRMEDLDRAREVPGAAASILATLEACGLTWDGPVVYQSQRLEYYREAAEALRRAGLAYPCGCSRADLRRAGRPGPEGPVYPGTCRTGLAAGRHPRSLRLRTDASPVTVHDRIQGLLTQRLEQTLGDFVIRRADGLFAYQLAVVVDDAEQGITEVVRGADLFASAPRQVYLQGLLGLPRPGYAHLPLALDEQGRKLSKQWAARPVARRAPLPALYAALAHLGQPLPEPGLDRPDSLLAWALAHWDPARIPRAVPAGMVEIPGQKR
jgi:glutamyl-Q tRNA(Asp) synthetase